MRLKRVRIFGFKTFADRVEFSLEGGIVAVVGPNGCGKSNLVDAILWGLGEGNARQLRAQSSQDVIFSGSAKRKPVGFSEVNLLFDNEDGALPIASAEITVTRRLNRNGDSEYLINRQACRLRDVYDLLADSGLGRAGYAIVGQKEIDSALSASAEDRRAWIDEAAGVQRYRARKVESLRRLAQAQDHLARVRDILRELEAQQAPLQEEAETALRYRTVQNTLREVEIGLLIGEAQTLAAELLALERKIEESGELARTEGERATAIDARMEELKGSIATVEAEIESVRVLQREGLTALERGEADLRLATQRLEGLDEQERTLSTDGSDLQRRVEETSVEVAALEAEATAEGERLDALRLQTAGADEEAKRLTADLKRAEVELTRAREAHARHLREVAETEHRAERAALAERELEGAQQALPDLQAGIAEAQATLDAAIVQMNEAQEAVKAAEAKIQGERTDEERDARAVRQSLSDKAALEGRRRGIEATLDAHEGLTQGARAVMEAAERGHLSGEYLPVGQAIEADRELALAVETALGASANDLIVEHESLAKAAVTWLKERRAGRATFQPIPLMRPVEPSYELRRLLGERGVLGRASELVQCKALHRPVIDSLLGRVLLVEDVDVALRLARTQGWSRMVTVEGEVVHSSGAVTGGQQSRQGYGLVQRRADLAEIETQIEKLDRVVRDFDARNAARRRRGEEAAKGLAEAKAAVQEHSRTVAEARSFVHRLTDELKSAEREAEKLRREIEGLRRATTTAPEVNVAAVEAVRDEALRAVAAKSADVEGAQERLREAEGRASQAQGRLLAGRRRLESARELEEARRRRAENLEPQREKARQDHARAEAEIVAAKERNQEADARFETLQTRRRERQEESTRLAEEAKHARDNALGISEALHQAEIDRARAESRRAATLLRLNEEYGMTEEDAMAPGDRPEPPADALATVNRLRRELRAMGDVNLGAIEAYERLTGRLDELRAQEADVQGGIDHVEAGIHELDKLTRDRFVNTFEQVRTHFSEMFLKLFGAGHGSMSLTHPDQILESGIDIEVTLPGKKRQPLNLLSGGERSLCTLAFLFSLLRVKPSPLVVLDEVDAPLDGRNVERFAETLREFTERTQFIVITHNPTTITASDVMLGVSMQEPGVSMLLPLRMPEAAPVEALTA